MHGVHTQSPPNRIAELLASRPDVKLVHLAAFCDVSESTANRWQSGYTPLPDHQKARVAEFFGVTRAYLMGWDTDSPAPQPNGAAA
jgi:hypothetical protein